MRFFISLSYDGSDFCGWQEQPDAPSVQAELERALSLAFGQAVEVTGAGRTDTGVNAIGYIAHFDIKEEKIKEPEQRIRKINAILPKGIVAFSFFEVPAEAHARYDATSRTYNYLIHTAKDPFAKYSYLYTFPIDVEAMNRAAKMFLGTKDFSALEKSGGAPGTSLCTVTDAHWEYMDQTHLVFKVTANRFLRNMVRAMVGTLLDVGRGKRPEEWISEVLESKDRCRAGQSVPGEALFLNGITYPYELKTI